MLGRALVLVEPSVQARLDRIYARLTRQRLQRSIVCVAVFPNLSNTTETVCSELLGCHHGDNFGRNHRNH